VRLVDASAATSGSYERGGHIIDPVTRWPAAGVSSATVVADDLGWADAWSTALIAAGENRTALMRSCHGLAAMLISADQTIATPAFPSV